MNMMPGMPQWEIFIHLQNILQKITTSLIIPTVFPLLKICISRFIMVTDLQIYVIPRNLLIYHI